MGSTFKKLMTVECEKELDKKHYLKKMALLIKLQNH
jgi:hypothetical protein